MIYNESLIMSTDDDCDLMMSITIGETILDELALCLDEHYSGNDDCFRINKNNLTKVIAVIDKHNLSIMAKHIGIPASGVREHLIEKFSDYGYISRISYVRDMFQEILDYILDCGGKYRFKKQ
jgi:hypothetical protein